MKKQINKLIEWHKAFGVFYKPKLELGYPSIDPKVIELRKRIMIEEVEEWAEAAKLEFHISDRAKELADILYTVFGTIISEGLQDHIERVFDAVHASNMSKLGTDGKPVLRGDGKVLKGPNFKEADLLFFYKIKTP